VRWRLETFFSEADREAIRAATATAERRTAGEIVVYVTERCDGYPEAAWKSALIGGAVGVLCGAAARWRFGGWGSPDYPWMLIGLQIGFLLGYAASRFDGLARRLVDGQSLRSRVEGRAAQAFLEERVFATRGRTGILIFVALFEHRVLVLADEGISHRVDDRAWDEISGDLASAIGHGAPAAATIRAVERCADLLIDHGVAAQGTDNELPDEPRFRRD
jgi:putative membrane protein